MVMGIPRKRWMVLNPCKSQNKMDGFGVPPFYANPHMLNISGKMILLH